MKKSIIVLLSMALIMTGCLAVKDPIKESPVKEVLQENVQEEVVQEREEIALPKIINVQNLGKDLWNENLLTQASITNISDYSDGFLYLSLFQAEGIPNTDSGVSTTKIIKFPNASQKYLDETSGEITDSHFSQCYKVLFDPDRTLILAGNNQSTEGMKVEAFQLSSGTIKWNIHKGLQATSNLDGSLYFTGDATDVIKTKDGGYVYISNLPDEAGKNTSFITKIQADGKEIWNKELSAKSPDLYLEQLVELNGVDSFLVLGRTGAAGNSCLIKISEGEIAGSSQLNFIAHKIKKVDDTTFFILGTKFEGNVNTPIILKLDQDMKVIYTFTDGDYASFSDFIKVGKNTYLFIGSNGTDAILSMMYDNMSTLEISETDTYPKLGEPKQIIQTQMDGVNGFVMTGSTGVAIGENVATYAWVAHLTMLKPHLADLYDEMTLNASEAKYLPRGNVDRTAIAKSIASFEGNGELMYIRFMKSDGLYGFVITGAWDNSQVIQQYLLRNEGTGWKVLEKYGVTDRIFEKIKTSYPEVNGSLLPPFEVADYVVKILDDQQLKVFIETVDQSKLVGDISFCSYIGDYFYVMFKDGADYLVKQPEYATREVVKVRPVIQYNFDLIDEEKPPFFLFMQN